MYAFLFRKCSSYTLNPVSFNNLYTYIYIYKHIYTYIHTYKKSYSACLFTRPEFKWFRHWVSYQSCCHWSLAQTEVQSSALARQKAKASICMYLKRKKYRH